MHSTLKRIRFAQWSEISTANMQAEAKPRRGFVISPEIKIATFAPLAVAPNVALDTKEGGEFPG